MRLLCLLPDAPYLRSVQSMILWLKIALLCLLTVVVGCVTTSQDDTSLDSEAAETVKAEFARCYATALTRKTVVARQACEDNVIARYAGRSPIFNVMEAQNKLAAIAYAEGRISQAEFKARVDSNNASATLGNSQPRARLE